jgi:hypothetical protein
MFEPFDSGLLIPIFGIFMIIAIVIGPIWIRSYFRARERAQLHETLRVAYEKGQPPPPELIEKLTGDSESYARASPSSSSERDLRRAVVLIFVGIGLAGLGVCLGGGISMVSPIGGWITGGAIAGSGAIPGMIGVAYLLLWLARPKADR